MDTIFIKNKVGETEIHIKQEDPMYVQLYEIITTYHKFRNRYNETSVNDVLDRVEDFRNVLLRIE